MKTFLARLERIRFTPRSTPWFLLLISFITYTLFFWQRGFYWDELPWTWIYYKLGPDMLKVTFSTSRPFWGMIYQITMPIVGPNPWAWQLLAMVMRWVTAVLLWKIMLALWPAHSRQALWASLLFLIFPGMGQHFIALMYTHFYIVLSAFLLSVYLSVLAVQNQEGRVWRFALSYVFAAINVFTMEYFYFLMFVQPFLYWIILKDDKRRLQKSILYFIPYFLVFLSSTLWRMFFFTFQNASYKYVLLDAIKKDFLSGILLLINTVLLSFWRTIVVAWIYPFESIGATGFGPLTLSLMIEMMLFVMVLVASYQFRLTIAAVNDMEFIKQAWVPSLVVWGLAGGSVWLIGFVPQLNFSIDRFMLPFMLGSSLILTVLISLLRGKPLIQFAIVASLVGFAFSRQFTLEETYRNDWQTQRSMFWQMSWRVPAYKKNTIIISNDLPVTFFSDNSLSGPLNWIYSSPGNMDVVMYFASVRLGSGLKNLTPNQPHELYYLGPVFHGNTSDVVIFNFEPPRCFRVMDPEIDDVNRLNPEVLHDIAKYSKSAQILTEGNPQLPYQLYGAEPAHSWCYYFEKADLARQSENWTKVVSLGDVAFSLEDHPNDPIERFVFIEGYAHTEQWKKAVELSKVSYKVSKNFVGPPLCKLWDRIERETKDSPNRESALQEVRSSFGCTP